MRTQIIGFKVTVITVGSALIAAASASPISGLFYALPAFVAFAFDLLVANYSSSIRQRGEYCRTILEPELQKSNSSPAGLQLWEQWMVNKGKSARPDLGNVAITVMVSLPAFYELILGVIQPWQAGIPFKAYWQAAVELLVLTFLMVFDVWKAAKTRAIVNAVVRKGGVVGPQGGAESARTDEVDGGPQDHDHQ